MDYKVGNLSLNRKIEVQKIVFILLFNIFCCYLLFSYFYYLFVDLYGFMIFSISLIFSIFLYLLFLLAWELLLSFFQEIFLDFCCAKNKLAVLAFHCFFKKS